MSCAHGISACSSCYRDTRQYEPISQDLTDVGVVVQITDEERERATRVVAAYVPAGERGDVLDMLGIGGEA